MSTLDAALSLAASGFRVFPLRENGKLPAIEGWQSAATTDPDKVRALWRDRKGLVREYNVGIRTGDGLLVLDVDCKDGRAGFVSLAQLAQDHGPLPPTLTSITASGGRHLFYSVDEPVRNSVGTVLGPGLDNRADGGLVVGPGSTIDGKVYAWDTETTLEIADAPVWLVARIGAPRTRDDAAATPVVDLDDPHAIASAIAWLEQDAPPAVSGTGTRDNTLYLVAAELKDRGLSRETAVAVMQQHYAGRCTPPQDPDEIERKVFNAFAYGKSSPGAGSPANDFDALPDQPAPAAAGEQAFYPPRWLSADDLDLDTAEPRQWIYGELLARSFVTVIYARGGSSKSTLALMLSAAVISGRCDILGEAPHEQTTVWYSTNEDDLNETRLRLGAIFKYHRISRSDPSLMPLAVNAADGPLLRFGRVDPQSGQPSGLNAKRIDQLVHHLVSNKIGLWIVDPLVEFHDLNENSNEHMRIVIGTMRTIAKRARCAILVIHHTKKGGDEEDGSADDSRGASAIINGARVAAVMGPMGPKTAEKNKISDAARHSFVRFKITKQNLAPSTGAPVWFRRESVVHEFPNGQRQSFPVLLPAALSGFSAIRDDGFSPVDLPGAKSTAKLITLEDLGFALDHVTDGEDRPAALDAVAAVMAGLTRLKGTSPQAIAAGLAVYLAQPKRDRSSEVYLAKPANGNAPAMIGRREVGEESPKGGRRTR